MAKRDYYDVLGVSKTANDDEIKKDGCVKFTHPSFYDYSANIKSSCFLSKLARATFMRIGSPRLYFL